MSQQSQSSQQMKVFVSHSHQNNAFCEGLVRALRKAGADVWYDDQSLHTGRLGPIIERELRARPVFIVVLSPSALTSQWVEDETRWFYQLLRRDPSRILLPVTAEALTDENNIWLFLQDFKRIEAPGVQPYPPAEAISKTLHALELTLPGEAPLPTTPQPTESAEDLVERGKALAAQQKYAEALPLFERATQLAPGSFDAWANLGLAYNESKQYGRDVDAYNRALAIDDKQAWVWNNMGNALGNLKRPVQERLDAYERATTLVPTYARAWSNKGNVLSDLKRYEEALAAEERATTLDPNNAVAWANKGLALHGLQRNDEALAAYERATTLDPHFAIAWHNMGDILIILERYEEALAAEERATTLDPTNAKAWGNKGIVLNSLRRYDEALMALEQAIRLGETAFRWRNKAAALQGLGRTAVAEAAERRAKELGG